MIQINLTEQELSSLLKSVSDGSIEWKVAYETLMLFQTKNKLRYL